MRLKTCSQNAERKKEAKHQLTTLTPLFFSKPAKLKMEQSSPKATIYIGEHASTSVNSGVVNMCADEQPVKEINTIVDSPCFKVSL